MLQSDGVGKAYLTKEPWKTAAGKIIKGLTAILVGHLLFNQSVSSISCSPEALGPKFLCLLQHMVAEACHEKLIILQGRVILFMWVRAGDRPAAPASQEGGAALQWAGGSPEETTATISRWWDPVGGTYNPGEYPVRHEKSLHKKEHHCLERCGFRFHSRGH